MKRKTYLAALAALTATAIVGSAYASKSNENNALAISDARIDIGQAVAAAERHVGGKASHAEYERHKGQWVFDVEVVKGKSVTDVKVDASNGQVIEARAENADHDEDGDQED